MKSKFTILSMIVVLAISFTASAFSQDKKNVEGPPVWNQIQYMNWFRDHGLPLPTYTQSDPMVYGNNAISPYVSPNFTDVPDIMVWPSNNAQSENSIAINNSNTNQYFISTNGMIPGSNPVVQQTWFFSTNAGTTWTGSETLPPTITDSYGDPVANFNLSGKAFFYCIGAPSVGNGIKLTTTTNLGVTWTAMVNADPSPSGSTDKQHAMCDISGTFPNNCYMSYWMYSGGNNSPNAVTRSTDGGATWQARVQTPVGALNTARGQGCNIAVGPNGEVYICWGHYPNTTAETGVGFTKSTDGGATYIPAIVAFPISGIRLTNGGDPLFNGVRVNSFPHIDVDRSNGPRRGYIYIVDADRSAGNADVKMWVSTDGGTTWGAGITVHAASTTQQWLPSVAVDKLTGNVAVAYYDFDSVGFYASRWLAITSDGGSSWDRGRISDIHFLYQQQGTPNTAAGYNGDYYETQFINNKVVPCWTQTRAGFTYNKAFIENVTLGPPPQNDIAVGPFLSFPAQFINANNYTIKAKVQNVGAATQVNIPIKFFVDGVQSGSTVTIPSLAAGAQDTVSASFTYAAVTGPHTLKIASGLAIDTNRLNDTVAASITVLAAPPFPVQWTYCKYNNPPKLIPDLGHCWDTINVNVGTPNGAVTDVNIKIDSIVHTWDSDLTFTLQHLAATCGFITSVGGSGDNFLNTILNDSATTPISSGTAPFTGTWLPSSPLSSMNTVPVNGLWVMHIQDNAGGDSGLLWGWCLTVQFQGVQGVGGNEFPTVFSVDQNYPNPFNPSTTIKYTMPKTGFVSIVIYDILGREVKTLVNENKPMGVYYVNFDASALASGVYFYKVDLAHGSFNAVKKMLLVK
jgi:hypothetical protein